MILIGPRLANSGRALPGLRPRESFAMQGSYGYPGKAENTVKPAAKAASSARQHAQTLRDV